MASSPGPPAASTASATSKKGHEQQTGRDTAILEPSDLPSTTLPASSTTEAGDKMVPRTSQRGGGRMANNSRREADLSALLTAAQKDELLLLAASITDAMQSQICQIFDQPAPQLISHVPINIANNLDLKKPGFGKRDNSPAAAQQQPADSTDEVQTHGGTHDKADPRGSQDELKKEAIAAFQKWQAAVAKRLSEIAVAREQPLPLQQQQQRTKSPNGKLYSGPTGRGVAKLPSAAGKPNGTARRGNSAATIGPGNPPSGASAAAITAPALTLSQFSMEKRQLLLHVMLLLLLSLATYPAYSRVFLARMANHFRVPLRFMAEDEARVAKSLSHAADSVWAGDGLLKKNEDGKKDRRGRVGGVPPGGPGASTALAASLNAAEVGSLVGGPGLGQGAAATVLGTLGTLADGGLATCIFFGMCGPRGSAVKTLDAFTKDIQDVSLLALHGKQTTEIREGRSVAPEDRRLRLSIGISGWLMQEDDVSSPWRVLGDKSEAYALGWERETMMKLGTSLDAVARSMAWQDTKREFAHRNVVASLRAFKWPGGLLKISKIVDNPWSVAMVRADKVGIALADAIIHKLPGERGVSLLGFGLGARVIYTCLMSLSERRAFGLVENVIMMGTPAPSSHCVWAALRSVVSGRVINVFSENDCMLGFLHRTSCIQFGVAGLQRILGVYGVENVDATKPVTNHLKYAGIVGRILRDIGWDDLDTRQVVKAQETLVTAEDEQEPDQQSKKTTRHQPDKHRTQKSRAGRKRTGRGKLEAQLQALSIAQ